MQNCLCTQTSDGTLLLAYKGAGGDGYVVKTGSESGDGQPMVACASVASATGSLVGLDLYRGPSVGVLYDDPVFGLVDVDELDFDLALQPCEPTGPTDVAGPNTSSLEPLAGFSRSRPLSLPFSSVAFSRARGLAALVAPNRVAIYDVEDDEDGEQDSEADDDDDDSGGE